MIKERYLLSGASGLLGTAIRTALTEDSAEVVRLVRHPPASSGELQWAPDAAVPFADPSVLEGFTAAIHLSGSSLAAHRWTPDYKRDIAASRLDSTRALATSLGKLRQPPKALLVASATGIYGERGDELLDERSAPGQGFLAKVCTEWEAAAQPAVDAGIRVVPLRFGVVLSREGGALGQMLPIFRLGMGGRLGSGRQWMSWIALPDVVSALHFALRSPDLRGPVNLVSPNPVTNADFTRALGRQLHRAAIVPAPAFALRLAFGEMADEALLASARVLPKKLLGAGFCFAHPELQGALAEVLTG